MDEFWLEDSPQGSFEAFNDFMRGEPGPYFTPRVDANGNLIWTNNGDLPNPETVNIKGPKGNTGNNGQDGKSAYQQAIEGGYRGSEGSFNDYMANFPSMASAAQTAASQASTAAGQAAASAAHASELVDTLPNDYEDLLQDTAKTIQAVESTTIGPASIVTFDASAADMPLKGLTVDIELVQSGSGDPSPDNVRPITGWTGCNVTRTGKNLANFIDGKAISSYGNVINSANRIATVDPVKIDPTKTYKVVCAGGNNVKLIYAVWNGNTLVRRLSNVSSSASIDTSGGTHFYVCCYETDPVTVDGVKPMVVFSDETDLTYEHYTGTTYSITFPDSAGTAYGDTLDVANKKLTVDRVGVKIKDITWTYVANYERFQVASSALPFSPKAATSQYSAPDGLMCECYQIHAAIGMEDKNIAITNNSSLLLKDTTYTAPSDLKAAVGENLIVYALASPIVYDLADIPDVLTIGGANNIWADCGDVTVTYGAYLETVKAYADKVGDSILSAIAPLETTYTASRGYAAGSFLFVGTKFYKVTAAIASGDTITPDTNVTQTTVAEQLMALAANA